MTKIAVCRFVPHQLELIDRKTLDEIEDSFAAAETRGIDILLIDTATRIREPQLVALGLADLIIASATYPQVYSHTIPAQSREARCSGEMKN